MFSCCFRVSILLRPVSREHFPVETHHSTKLSNEVKHEVFRRKYALGKRGKIEFC